MFLVKHVPLSELRSKIYKLIKGGQTHTIYGAIDTEDASLPYLTMGAITLKPSGSKDLALWKVSVQIHAWTGPDDMATMNAMLDDIVALLSSGSPGLEVGAYKIIDAETDLVESYEETSYGFHGIVTELLTIS